MQFNALEKEAKRVNNSTEKILGYSNSDWLEKNIWDYQATVFHTFYDILQPKMKQKLNVFISSQKRKRVDMRSS